MSKAAKKKAAAPEEAPPRTRPASASLPIEGEPPPMLANYAGKQELLRELPSISVTLDYGAFMWLWRIAEAKAVVHINSSTTKALFPEQVEVALRAVSAFRHARRVTTDRLADLSGGRKRVLKRAR